MITIDSVSITPNPVECGKSFYISVGVTDTNTGLWLIDKLGNFLKDRLGNYLKSKAGD